MCSSPEVFWCFTLDSSVISASIARVLVQVPAHALTPNVSTSVWEGDELGNVDGIAEGTDVGTLEGTLGSEDCSRSSLEVDETDEVEGIVICCRNGAVLTCSLHLCPRKYRSPPSNSAPKQIFSVTYIKNKLI